MKIAFFSTKPYDKIWFEPLGNDYGYDFLFLEAKLCEETVQLAHGCDGVCAFVNDDLNGNVIKGLYDLGIKAIFMRCAGFNNVDLNEAQGKIEVLHVPGYSPEAVAEYAMALLLTVNRQTHRAYLRTRDFNMNINGLMGTDLYCKTAGVIGTGRIGQAMVNVLKGFGMRILAYDLYPNNSLDVEYVELDELFAKSDVITLHCPLTKETEYILNKESFNKMKNGVFIINTSRGMLIKTDALLEALLVPGKIGGVGLDVYEEEGDVFYEDRSNEIMQDNNLARLMTFPNVVVTSHQGYFTAEAMQAIAIETLENIFAFDNGNELVNVVRASK
ncbi:MAG: 2-hydroxyacid dehydrogenase [Lachnospiraceae bacterium]|nr:2-hydroxyacid dehydrogenase [Lachnospiraceae bacterium]